MTVDSKYLNINRILSYGRMINIIVGGRSLGKSYTTQKWIIDKCLKTKKEFVYVVRTKAEKYGGTIGQATSKVCLNEFGDIPFDSDNDNLYLCHYETVPIKGTNEFKQIVVRDRIIGRCIALSEAGEVKKKSFPLVDYIIFDEFLIENATQRYVNGWKEPDLLLNILLTIDRDESRIKVFMLANTVNWVNPYFTHDCFKIKKCNEGQFVAQKLVLFYFAPISDELRDAQKSVGLRQLIEGTSYGTYADGKFITNTDDFIDSMPSGAHCCFNIVVQGTTFGYWSYRGSSYRWISTAHNDDRMTYTFYQEDVKDGVYLVNRSHDLIKKLKEQYYQQKLYYDSMFAKEKFFTMLVDAGL